MYGTLAYSSLLAFLLTLGWKRSKESNKEVVKRPFTKEAPLRVHWLRPVTEELRKNFDSLLADNVVLTCIPTEAAKKGMSGTATARELLGEAAAKDQQIHVLVEGFLPAATTDLVLSEAKPSSFLIPYAGVSPALRSVLEGTGVAVFNSHHNAPMTAEMCSSLLLAAAKQTVRSDAELRSGSWVGRGVQVKGGPIPAPPCQSLTLQGKRAVILGLRGSIGKRVAKVCAALEMEVVGTSASIKPSAKKKWQPMELGNGDGTFSARAKVFPASEPLVDLLRGAAAVIVACPLTEETKGKRLLCITFEII